MVATFADNFSKMVVTSNADWDEAHPAGTSLDDVLQVRINSSSDFVHDGYDMGEYKYEFLQNYDYLKTIEKRPSELTAADMKMVYYSLTDFSSQTKSPVIVFTSAPTLEKEHTLTLRWTTVEGDVKEIKEDVKAITGKAGKRWDGLVDKILAALAGAFIAWLLAGVAL